MKNFVLLFALALIFILSFEAQAQWVQIKPSSDQINCFAVSGSNLFAGTQGSGILLSTDNASSWKAVNSGLTNTSILSLAVSPTGTSGTNIFAGTNGEGVFLSTNNGTSWEAVNKGISSSNITAIVVSGKKMFAGTIFDGVFSSTDNGANWTPAGLAKTYIGSLLISETNLFAGSSDGIFLSTNDGTSWSKVNTGLTNVTVTALAIVPDLTSSSGSTLYAGTDGVGILSSTNNGTSWVQTNLNNVSVSCLAVSGNNLIAGIWNVGIYVSTDNWKSWTIKSDRVENYIRALAVDSTSSGTNIFAGFDNGNVYLSTDNGKSWTLFPMSFTDAICFASYGSNLFAGTDVGIFLSTNEGADWKALNSGLTSTIIRCLAIDSSTGRINLFAGTDDGVFISTNYGTNWTHTSLTNLSISALALNPISSGIHLFAGTAGQGVFLSTNNGTSWVQKGLNDVFILSLLVSDSTLFAGTPLGLFILTDYDTNWEQTSLTSWTTSIVMSGSNLFSIANGVSVSTDNGTSWATVDNGLTVSAGNDDITAGNVYSLLVSSSPNGTDIFAGTDGGVYHTNNNGKLWRTINNGFPILAFVNSLAVNGANLFAGVDNYAVWRRPLSEITGLNDKQIKLPTSFKLEQNYPNPFNPSTTINYQLPMTSYVTLNVYDILGREVKTLINEQQTAGNHSVTFNAEGLASGVYFYRIKTGEFNDVKKLLLLK
jgi:ligand-binding sensor domain-containing protein